MTLLFSRIAEGDTGKKEDGPVRVGSLSVVFPTGTRPSENLMQTRIIQDRKEFRTIAEAWDELLNACEVKHHCISHAWFSAWIDQIGNCRSLQIVTCWSDGQLVAAAPLHVTAQIRKGVRVRSLTFLSSGISPRCNFLVHPSSDPKNLFDAIFRVPGCSLLSLNDLEQQLDTTQAFLQYLGQRHGNLVLIEPGRQSPYVKMAGDFEAYLQTLSKSFRYHLRRGRKKLDSAGAWTLTKTDNFSDFETAAEEMLMVSANSWKAAEKTDLVSRRDSWAFYQAFSRSCSGTGAFELWLLRLDGKLIAFDYYVNGPNSLSLLRNDFDLDYEQLHAGNNLRFELLQDLCTRDGAWEYDMGGQAYDYKLRWTRNKRAHINITTYTNFYGKLLCLAATRFRRPADRVEFGREPISATPVAGWSDS